MQKSQTQEEKKAKKEEKDRKNSTLCGDRKTRLQEAGRSVKRKLKQPPNGIPVRGGSRKGRGHRNPGDSLEKNTSEKKKKKHHTGERREISTSNLVFIKKTGWKMTHIVLDGKRENSPCARTFFLQQRRLS